MCIRDRYKQRWYFFVLLYSLLTSVLYHFSRLGYYGPMDKFQTWDIAAQNVVVSATFFVLVFVTLPEWTYLFMAGVGIFVAAMGSVAVGSFLIYELFCGIIMLSVFVYLIIRTIRPIKIRDNTYIALACLAALVAVITFLFADRQRSDEVRYTLVHSMWHVSAYTMLYFALKSIQNEYEMVENRSPREDMAVAY